MVIQYRFDGMFFDYEVEINQYVDKILSLFAKNYDISINSVKSIYNDDWLNWDRLLQEFKYEVKDSFEDEAYKAFLDWRCLW